MLSLSKVIFTEGNIKMVDTKKVIKTVELKKIVIFLLSGMIIFAFFTGINYFKMSKVRYSNSDVTFDYKVNEINDDIITISKVYKFKETNYLKFDTKNCNNKPLSLKSGQSISLKMKEKNSSKFDFENFKFKR